MEIKSVDLSDAVEGVGDIKFTRAEWMQDASPFVIIRYTLAGKEVSHGIALDLDKRIFLPDVQNEILHDPRVQAKRVEISKAVSKLRKFALA
jgi:hypothetical protein